MGKGKQPENWDELVKSMSNNITPSQVSSQLKLIASKISNSKSPDKDLVVKDLQLLINKISSDEPEMTKLYEESDFKTYKKSDFAQFDQVTEYEEFGSCEVIDVKDGMLTICFRDDVSPTGQINKFYKFPPSVADKTIFLDPDEEEFFGQPEYPSTKVGPGFVCDQLWLKKGVGDLLGLI
jgi:hypothetical protein